MFYFNKENIKRILWILAAVGIMTGTQLILNQWSLREDYLAEAFYTIAEEKNTAVLEMTGTCGNNLSELEKKQILAQLAEAVGITKELTITDVEEYQGKRFYDKGKDGTITMTISQPEENKQKKDNVQCYLHVQIELWDNIRALLVYKEELEQKVEAMELEYQTCLSYETVLPGRVNNQERKEMASSVLSLLQAKVVAEYEQTPYTLYAYTKKVDSCRTINSKKVNIALGISYDEENNVTRCYLASPIIRKDY